MHIKKKAVLFGISSIFILACFIAMSNATPATSRNREYFELTSPNSSDTTNLDVINAIFEEKNDFFRKLSNYVQDLILTSSIDHVKYESYSEAEMLVILKGFDEMMEMKGSGKDGAITKNDVIKIFRGTEWVLNGPDGKGGKNKDQGWFFSKEGFNNMLLIFNERKNKLKNEGFDQFLKDDYDTVYERFYLNFPHGSGISIADADGFYSLVVPHPTLGDFAMGLNFDSGFLYPEY